MKINNKGFAISTFLYGMLLLLVMIVMLTLQIMRTNNNNNKELSNEIMNNLSKCRNERINYSKCTTGCDSLKIAYENCLNN